MCVSFSVICALYGCSQTEDLEVNPHVSLNRVDSLAMLDIYKKTGGGVHWGKSWNLTDHRTWEYVITEKIGGEDRIVNVTIPDKAYGSFPASIGELTELRILYLNGSIVGELPASIGNLKKLKILSVVGTILGGKIPKEISKLQELEHLYLVNNGMTGEIPIELALLPKLKLINLSHNHFYGSVPLKLLETDRGTALDYNDITNLPWDCWLNEQYTIPTMTFNRLSGKVPTNVLTTQKWKEYSWAVSLQQEGYGYIE